MYRSQHKATTRQGVGPVSIDLGVPMLRSSERATFKRCPQRWKWSYVDGLQSMSVDTGARWFGTGLHLSLAEFYIPGRKRGRPLLDTWQEYTKNTYNTIRTESPMGPDEKAVFMDARKLGREMLTFYMDTTDGDPHWDVISPEQRFQVYIPGPDGKPVVLYVGTFDLAIRDLNDGRIKLVDHKSSGGMPSSGDLATLELDDQAGPYISLSTFVLRRLGLIGPKENVVGMEYNYLIKRVRDQRPTNEYGQYLNKNGTVSKVQPPDPYLRHFVGRTAKARRRQVERIAEEAVVMAAVRSGAIPTWKTPTKDCKFCDFFDLCQVHENGGDWERMAEMAYKKGDPYADHREGAGNSKISVELKRKTGVM